MKNYQFNRLLIIGVLFLAQTCALAQQPDANTFLDLLRQAQQKSQAQDWAAAVPLWERVVAINPYYAWFWYPLGRAQFNAGEYRKAAQSFEKSLDLGAGRLATIALDVARSYAMLKEKELTLKWIGRALDLGFRWRERIHDDEAFAFLRSDPRFKAFTAEIDKTRMSRTEGWLSDLSFLETEIKRIHYRPFRKVPQAQFESELQRLRGDVPRLTDNQIIVRIMRLMSMIGDGHTALYPDLNAAWHTVPLQFELYDEGLYVIAADPKYADMVGTRVVRFGQHTTEELFKAVVPIISRDNEKGITRSFNDFIRYPNVLNGLGLMPPSDSINITVRYADGRTRTVDVRAVQQDPQYSRITGDPKWVTAYQNSAGPLPLYLKDRRTPFWFEAVPGQPKTLYFQFNLVEPSPTETFAQFVARLFKFIDEHQIEKLIIDMRWNNGGNTFLLPPLINGVIAREKINQTGKLFVIVGRYVFSAAINAAAYLEQNTNAILVGEPTPSGPNFVAESNIITLPFTGTRVSIADVYFQATSNQDTRTWIAPLLFVPVTFEAYKTKRDPALDTILAYPKGN